MNPPVSTSSIIHRPLNLQSLAIEDSLPEKERLALQQDWAQLHQPPSNGQNFPNLIPAHYINAKQLACPMPLLKLKMALKTTAIGDTIYMTATDPNTTHDIGAFCQHLGYALWTAVTESDSATIFHLLITKNS